MKFRVDQEVLNKFPGLNVGLLVVKGINNKGVNEEVLKLIKEQEKRIRSEFSTETLSQNPRIDAWRKAYSSFGAKPKKYKCSVEALYRRIIKGEDLRPINKLVDTYNLISIKHLVPAGGDDLNKVEGAISLRLAKGDEQFTALNSDEVEHPKPGEVVYVDDKEVLCRRWNWRECNKSKMTEETVNAALVIEGLPPVTKQEVKEIINELKDLVQKACGGEGKAFILNKDKPEAEFQ